MANYDFTELSPIDFEDLCRDLLQRELDLTLQSFMPGKDSGIDFLHSKNDLIIQCKHYIRSGFQKLIQNLKLIEFEKVSRLKPKRYILITSLGLTPLNKNLINTIFSPYIQSTDDIYGKNDINNLLGKFEDIEKKHFKLWLTSLPILDTVLHSAIHNYSIFEKDNLIEKAKLYVQNESFPKALKILKEQKTCIISGIPGIGKTTLAEILLLYLIKEEYEIIKISSDISEAYATYKENTKQVFYYDDFLGQTTLNGYFNKNEDKRLLNFIDKLHKKKNKLFILTTREYLLNQAKETYESFSNSDLKYSKCIIDLSSYTRIIRAKILYNHLYFSNFISHLLEDLLHNKNYLKIIDHKNFSPRIIEWMTSKSAGSFKIERYFENFIKILDNPEKLWEHSFKHLSNSGKNLLIILTTLPPTTFIKDVESAFINFHKFCAKELNFSTNPKDFLSSLKELDGTFIKTKNDNNKIYISFHNPSIRDYLENYVNKDETILYCICKSSIYFSQYVWIWGSGNNDINSSAIKNNHILKNLKIEFWEGISKTLSQGNPAYIKDKEYLNNEYQYTKQKQLSFVLHSHLTAKCPLSDNLIKVLFNEFFENLDNGFCDHLEIFKLLKFLQNINFTRGFGTSIDFIIAKIKVYILKTINDTYDLNNIQTFYDNYSNAFTENDLQRINQLFSKNCNIIINDIIQSDFDTSSDTESKIDIFNSFIINFKISEDFVKFYQEDLEQFYEEKLLAEEAQSDYDYESLKELSNKDSYNAGSEEQEIIEMFNSLKNS